MSGLRFNLNLDEVDLPEVDDSGWTVKLNCGPCRQCGRKYPGSDRSGGHCDTCHYSFASQTGFNKHRTGPYDGQRRCYTPDELVAKGWTLDDHGVYRMPAPTHWNTTTDRKD